MRFLLTIAAMVSINIRDVDYDGTHNYLLQFKKDFTPYYVSYSSRDPLIINGQAFALMDLSCDTGPTIDEEMSDKLNQWISYTVATCDVIKIREWVP